MSAQVTRVKPDRRDPQRCHVYVGERAVAKLPREQLAVLGIGEGTPWTEEVANQVHDAAVRHEAHRQAIRLVERRMIGTEELADRLRRRGFDAKVARETVDHLQAHHLLDDVAYGRALIEAERARRPTGAARLRQKLIQKRLPPELVDRLVDEADAGYDAVHEARELARARLRTTAMQRADTPTRTRRLWGLLTRRGFDAETIRAALDDVEEG